MKSISRKLSPRRRGLALPLVVCVLAILLALGGGLLSLGLHAQTFAIRTGDEIQARCAADAGLTKAIFEMNEKLKVSPWNDSTLPQATDQPLPNCDATFSCTVTGDLETGYAVESIGKSGHTERKVNATLRLRGLFEYGILVKETIKLMAGTLVDGYDSSDATHTDVLVQVATVSTDPDSVAIKPGVDVDGDIFMGVDNSFPEVTPPALADLGTDIYAKGTTLTIGPEHSGIYTNLTLLGETLPGVLEVNGGDVVLYITGDVWLGHGCEITIKPDSSLTIYLDGDWTSGNSSGINNETETAISFALYGTGQDQKLEIKAKEDWYGVIYAPNADLIIKANGDVYGSFVANSLENKAKGLIWYDAALRDAGIDNVGVRFTIKWWWEQQQTNYSIQTK